jgi:ABC-type lipoprotein release transport system permease subunit
MIGSMPQDLAFSVHDPSIYVAVIALISAVALAASAIPALRASHIDPAACLRE